MDELTWQYTGMVAAYADFDAQEIKKAFQKVMQFGFELEETEQTVTQELSVSFLSPLEAADTLGQTQDEKLSGRFLYAYLSTVYGADGKEKAYILPEGGGNLWNLSAPLKKEEMREDSIRDTWYNDRDEGYRKHTGADIRANAGADIMSCTDGRVSFIGTGEKSGNFVIITDQYGYEYHYYHMIELTDFLQPGDTVQAGELIGHVGSTGNSDANHLHLTIISNEGEFINPAPFLQPLYQ